MTNEDQPNKPDIEASVRPFEHGVILGRHEDGSMTLRLAGEFVLKVNPARETPATPSQEWVFPTINSHDGEPMSRGRIPALSLYELEEPEELFAPEPEEEEGSMTTWDDDEEEDILSDPVRLKAIRAELRSLGANNYEGNTTE